MFKEEKVELITQKNKFFIVTQNRIHADKTLFSF